VAAAVAGLYRASIHRIATRGKQVISADLADRGRQVDDRRRRAFLTAAR
jgi:hypothetical protein